MSATLPGRPAQALTPPIAFLELDCVLSRMRVTSFGSSYREQSSRR